jgi:protein phosphatase 2C family protein 2/3
MTTQQEVCDAIAARQSDGPSYGIATRKNQRGYQEDTYAVHTDPEYNIAYFSVHDGHNGNRASQMAKHLLYNAIVTRIGFIDGNYEEAIRDGYMYMDYQIMSRTDYERWEDGSTACSALVIGTDIFIGNCGNSEIVLGTVDGDNEYTARLMTEKHTLRDNADERARIIAAGGSISYDYRVNRTLSVSRAFGDRSLKYQGGNGTAQTEDQPELVTAKPYTGSYKLRDEQVGASFLILASDGLWDTVSYQQATDFVAKRMSTRRVSAETCAELLVNEAIRCGSQDNITVIVVYL